MQSVTLLHRFERFGVSEQQMVERPFIGAVGGDNGADDGPEWRQLVAVGVVNYPRHDDQTERSKACKQAKSEQCGQSDFAHHAHPCGDFDRQQRHVIILKQEVQRVGFAF